MTQLATLAALVACAEELSLTECSGAELLEAALESGWLELRWESERSTLLALAERVAEEL